MIKSLIIASSLTLSSAEPETPPQVKKLLKTSRHIHTPKELLPKSWTHVTAPSSPKHVSVSGVSAEPAGYFVANQYMYSSECSSKVDMKYATGTGVCFVGMTNNTVAGSLAYEFVGVYGDAFLINQGVWESTDCTGDPVVNTIPIPTTCLPNEENPDDAALSFAYTYEVGATPWTYYDPGFMFQYYDTSDHCDAGGVGGAYAYFAMNSCIKSEEGGSFYFSACDGANGLYTIAQFADDYCKAFLSSVTTRLQACTYEDSTDEEMSPYTYATYMCN